MPHRWGCSLHSSISTTVKLVLSKGYISSITDTLETALRVLDHTDGGCSLHSSLSTTVKLILSQFTLIYIYNSEVIMLYVLKLQTYFSFFSHTCKMLVIWAGIHKKLVRIANQEDRYQADS